MIPPLSSVTQGKRSSASVSDEAEVKRRHFQFPSIDSMWTSDLVVAHPEQQELETSKQQLDPQQEKLQQQDRQHVDPQQQDTEQHDSYTDIDCVEVGKYVRDIITK